MLTKFLIPELMDSIHLKDRWTAKKRTSEHPEYRRFSRHLENGSVGKQMNMDKWTKDPDGYNVLRIRWTFFRVKQLLSFLKSSHAESLQSRSHAVSRNKNCLFSFSLQLKLCLLPKEYFKHNYFFFSKILGFFYECYWKNNFI